MRLSADTNTEYSHNSPQIENNREALVMAEKPANLKASSTRLTSLGRPRDLHLSVTNTAKPKKVFAPNLNAVRNKGKAVPSIASDGNHRKNKRQSKDFKKRDSEASRFVQSTGIFSEGAAEIKRESSYAARGSDAREGGGGEPGAGMEKPKINTAAVWDIDLQEEAKTIANLLDNYENIQDDAEYDDYQPVVLPLKKNQSNFFKTFAPQLLPDVKVKPEVAAVHVEDVTDNLSQCSFNQPNLYSNTNIALSLVKLPDTMPGRGFNEEGKPIDYTLEQMLEGQIGKIVKRRSGKMQMIIGNMTYDLSSVEGAPFTEELMAMPDANSTEHSATMTSLSAVNERYVVSPAWRNLLSKQPDT